MEKFFHSRKSLLNTIILFLIVFISLKVNIVKSNQREIIGLDSLKKGKTLESNDRNKFANIINWKKIKSKKIDDINWQEYFEVIQGIEDLEEEIPIILYPKKYLQLNSLNRSIVFDNKVVGPDISWIIPPGLAWNKKYRLDLTARGHNTKIPEPENKNFFGWNDGDATGLFSYQFLHYEKSSFGLNLGIRSLYQGEIALGGATSIGEGLSSGFRWDYALSNTSGIAFGAEQLIHYDSLTDSGRNLYIIASKAWMNTYEDQNDSFPIDIVTGGIGTGRMAVGTIRGFCTDSLGGAGTETKTKRNLCWSPVFSLARVWNKKFSTFFEYNSRFFLAGTSLAPTKKVPIRGTFALILSDHIDNYKVHNMGEMNWVFNLSLGF